MLNDVPLDQLFALLACRAWSQGMEPELGGSYADRDFDAAVTEIMARKAIDSTGGR